MKMKRLSAAVMAAAVLAVAAPVTGVLPNPLGVTASAAEYQAGDVFYAFLAKDGTAPYIATAEEYEADAANLYGVYQCTVKSDGTIKIGCHGAITPYPQFGKTLTIPSEINGYTVTELGPSDKYSFGIFGCKKVVIPDTVTTIGENAFWKSCFLEEVEFGEKSQLKLIDQWAFQDCRSLKSITIPASVETIMEGAFGNTDQKLDGFYDRDQNTDLDFTDTYSLTTVNFAEGSKLKLIDQWAFQGQEALKSITLPDSLEKIGYGAFIHCTALTKINVPKNVNEIGAFAFQISGWNNESGNISEITVDENNPNFKSVDGVVFSKDGKTIVAYPVAKSGKYEIPADVNKIAEGAFGYCPKLTSVTIPEGVTEIPENAFSTCTSLAEVKLPSTLTTIAKWGFEATALTSINIPESVTAIDAHAFESSSLKSISGTAGSYAETFAKENGYTFNSVSKDEDNDPNTFTDESGDKAADVQVIAKPNVIPKKAQFSVRLDDANSTANRIAYNCYFTYNGAEYEPTDTVTVRIPVPVAMRDIADTLKVYHLQDGKYVNMSAKVENGYLVFDTDHFSTYVVTAENLENESVTPGGSDSADNSNDGNGSDSADNSDDGSGSGNGNGADQKPTGIALAIPPVVLAASAAIVISKKRK